MSMRVYVRTHIHTCRWLSYPHDMYTQTHCHTYSRLSKSIGIVRCMCPEIGKEKIVASNAVETYILWTWNALLAANKWRMLSLHASIFNCVCSTDKSPRSIKSTVWQIYSFEWIWFEMTCVSLYDILLCWPFSRRLSLSVCLPRFSFCAYSCCLFDLLFTLFICFHMLYGGWATHEKKHQHRFSRSLSCETKVRICFLFAPDMDFLLKCLIQINH